jgi:hypothetical protein
LLICALEFTLENFNSIPKVRSSKITKLDIYMKIASLSMRLKSVILMKNSNGNPNKKSFTLIILPTPLIKKDSTFKLFATPHQLSSYKLMTFSLWKKTTPKHLFQKMSLSRHKFSSRLVHTFGRESCHSNNTPAQTQKYSNGCQLKTQNLIKILSTW